jgi:hypothetical protein
LRDSLDQAGGVIQRHDHVGGDAGASVVALFVPPVNGSEHDDVDAASHQFGRLARVQVRGRDDQGVAGLARFRSRAADEPGKRFFEACREDVAQGPVLKSYNYSSSHALTFAQWEESGHAPSGE